MKKYLVFITSLIALTMIIVACDDANSQNAANDNNHSNQDTSGEAPSDNSSEKENSEDTKQMAWPDGHLQKLDENQSVKQLQKKLIEIGYELEATGNYDQATTNAVTDIQLQLDDLMVLGVYNQATHQALEAMDNETLKQAIAPGEMMAVDNASPVSGTDQDNTPVVVNPYDQLALINKSHALPKDYQPDDLVVPDVRFPFDQFLEKKQLRKVAADALEKLFDEADKAGHHLFAQSGFRSYDTQVSLFNRYAEKNGEKAANKFSARPGESEHQSGLTMDITSESMSFQLTTDFGSTPEGKWVKAHAADFGFIIRYPKGKEDITKYQYEPWHLRYVGKQTAQTIMSNDLVLEEYLNTD